MTVQQQLAGSVEELQFDNRFTRELPADPEPRNFRRQVHKACFSRVLPKKVARPQLVAYSREVAELLDLAPEACENPEFAEVFAGNRVLAEMDPFAMCYGGHQFGNWAGQLGDGRAINLGEVLNHRGQHWTLQLKGAGPTPYSRMGDGLAVLRSSVREFLCSEAMFHLGIPTTRALSLVLTGEQVVRDMFYDGRPELEPGAIVCRVAPSFTRFGNFQIFASLNDLETLRNLADFTVRADFPHLVPGDDALITPATYVAMFEEVCRTTAQMIVHWMRVGFVHGVMNTDNMSILGLTIDYGPYGWLENHDLGWTPNTTDAAGRRYCYGQQPQIAMWNLVQLATALLPLVEHTDPLQQALETYSRTFKQGWEAMMAQKLGLSSYNADADDELTAELLELLQIVEADMTIFFRRLAMVEAASASSSQTTSNDVHSIPQPLLDAYYVADQLTRDYRARLNAWLRSYLQRLEQDGTSAQQRRERMNRANPKFVLRNYLAQLAIDKAEQDDFSMIGELLEVLRHPYDEQPQHEELAAKRPDWARHRAGCSMLSCSS